MSTALGSSEVDHALTPGGTGRLLRGFLRFDPGDPDQGVFFVAADHRAVRVEKMIQNKPSELFFVVPALPAGTYSLEVRVAFNGDAADLRTGRLLSTLTVA